MLKEIKEHLDCILCDTCHVNLIDYICLKLNDENVSAKVYCFEGHPLFEQNLDAAKMQHIKDIRKLDCYGISEIPLSLPLGSKDSNSKIEIRLNTRNKEDYFQVLQYCKTKISIDDRINNLLEQIATIDDVLKEESDYCSLYFGSFNYDSSEYSVKSIGLYFKTFGLDDDKDMSLDYLSYLGKIEIISNDASFILLKKLVDEHLAILRSICIEINNAGNFKIKYYVRICNKLGAEKILECIKPYANQTLYLDLMNSYADLKLDFCQITSGFSSSDKGINLYYVPKRHKEKFYSLRNGIVLRNIAGIYFLVDIHDKHCYELKKLYKVNETGKCIIELLNNHIWTLTGIVSYICSVIVDYKPEMYDMIYNDCKEFICFLIDKGYVKEV